MAVIRWNPASDLMNLHSEMDRLFGELTEGLGVTPRAQGQVNGRGDQSAFLPLDIERGEKELVIHASVPGFSPDEVGVTVDNGVLTIEAQHSEQAERRERRMIRQERFSGRLYRQIALGDGVDGEAAAATFKNGVLTVTVPLVQRPEPRKIKVKATEA